MDATTPTRRQITNRVSALLNQITYRKGSVVQYDFDDERIYLQVTMVTRDTQTGKPLAVSGRKWHLSPFMTDSEIVATAFKAFLTAEEHECREHFMFRGRPVFGPHLNVSDLVDAISAGTVRMDARP